MVIIKDLKVKQRYTELKSEKEALVDARRKLNVLTKELQAKLHTQSPHECLDAAIRKLDMQISGIEALIKRIETIGR